AFATDLVREADTAFNNRKWSDAERLTRQALEQDSSVSGAHRLLGAALARLYRYDEALSALKTAVQRDPKDAKAFNLLGWTVLNGGGDLDAAEAAFKQALTLNPKYANAEAGLGQVQLGRKETSNARATFNRAVELDNTEPAANQGVGHLALRANDYAAAESQFRTALRYAPLEVVSYLDLAISLLDQDRADEAKHRREQRQVRDGGGQAHLEQGFGP